MKSIYQQVKEIRLAKGMTPEVSCHFGAGLGFTGGYCSFRERGQRSNDGYSNKDSDGTRKKVGVHRPRRAKLKMNTLYAHQKRFIAKNPNRALLVWETGTGKTVAACEWIKKRRAQRALVICPKAIVGKWERDLVEWKAKAGRCVDVAAPQSHDLSKYGVLVLDEAQHFASPLFAAGRSIRTKDDHLQFHPRAHQGLQVLLLTATPVRSTPYNIHTLACYLGKYWPVKSFRDKFFYFTDMFGRWHWEKRPGMAEGHARTLQSRV